jgi:hypothetical protein
MTDGRLEANHRKGLFYSFWQTHRTNLCLLSFDEHVFEFRMPKTFQNVQAVLAKRTGPEMLSLRHWDTNEKTWLECERSEDGFQQLCQSFETPNCDFSQNAPHTAVDRERLLTLSAGYLKPRRDWHNVRNMDSFTAEADERTKRLTFTHEPAVESNNFRNECLARFIRLQMAVLTNPVNFPANISDLVGNWRFEPPRVEDGYRFNVVNQTNGDLRATAIFVGLQPRHAAEALKGNLIREWGVSETRRLVIWYEDHQSIRVIPPSPPNFTDDSEPPDSIARPTAS